MSLMLNTGSMQYKTNGSSQWQPLTLVADVDLECLADEFSTSSTYEIGEYVRRGSKAYRCITAVTTAGPWDSSKWLEVTLANEIGNLVHVGASAPSDDSVKIWFDTDEPGVSAVTTVNGANGDVVLDAYGVGAMYEWALLWENASPTSEFASQVITLNLAEYHAVCVGVGSDSNTLFTSLIIPIGKTGTSRYSTRPSGSNIGYVSRTISTSSSGVTFGSASLIVQGTSGTTTGNNYNVPYFIYGIKGFSN